ncbi:hypothetical protein GCM10023335_75480 [Streptomyces siamensis]|uniref:Uncharacterized protein n=1 Tax=Streptomyces siamensis TaxID=1274986 RepID=A0ABP9JHX3_9ACTN
MDQADVMDAGQCLCEAGTQVSHRRVGESAFPGHEYAEVGRRYVLACDPRRHRIWVRVQYMGRPKPTYPPCGFDLASQARTETPLGGDVLPHDLHRDTATTTRPAEENLAHAPCPEPGLQHVSADLSWIASPEILHRFQAPVLLLPRTIAQGKKRYVGYEAVTSDDRLRRLVVVSGSVQGIDRLHDQGASVGAVDGELRESGERA